MLHDDKIKNLEQDRTLFQHIRRLINDDQDFLEAYNMRFADLKTLIRSEQDEYKLFLYQSALKLKDEISKRKE